MTVATLSPNRPASNEERWAAVSRRDIAADGEFVFAVASTGVYCRPGCPARRPRRDNVRFFDHPADAEEAGYRPCRRCRPDAAGASAPLELTRRAAELIDGHESGLDPPLTLARLGERLGVSPHHLQRTFKKVVGLSPRQYADARRVQTLKARLRTAGTVTEAMYHAGYGSPSRLYEQARAQLGMTPAAYRNGAKGIAVQYTIAGTPFGRMLVASTEKGICAVSLGDSDDELEAALGEEFPGAAIRRQDEGLRPAAASLLRQLERGEAAALPLDVRATAFQRRVWEALRSIPRGATRTYQEVAEAIGAPAAVRAVGRACATNPAAILIPCHRVVPAAGGVGGYRWGAQRKRALLAQEEALAGAEEPVAERAGI
ncbi:MAG: bifunctional DNA-binding transcriptional regulator/O6-methylguanine-DNA methyltransferase Ada [Chloroflexota bacterium]|nr:bifunctional DNA-binding transcriptional regulator/O6-methylguanine-DNA methyltransferase Ada [Chloroflexota bacterium]